VTLKRRDFITLLGGAAAWPLTADAQQAIPLVGLLSPGTPELRQVPLGSIRAGLAEAGFVEGRNLTIDYRWAGDQIDRLEALAAELVGRGVRVIIALGGERGALAAKAATTSIPIVFAIAGDPVDIGLVQSLNRPGGNLTGGSTLSNEVAAKEVELLHEVFPAARVIALLVDRAYVAETNAQVEEAEKAAHFLGLRLQVLDAHTDAEIEAAFGAMVAQRADALVVSGGSTFIIQSDRVVALAARFAIPAVYPYQESARAGGLMSYGMSVAEVWRLAGLYAGRILKGEKAGDLPVQQATKVELNINLKTAKALGLTVPNSLLARADEVIE
jgi:putative ABC transport system substrate-binding protein